jgi:hypothetical protein
VRIFAVFTLIAVALGSAGFAATTAGGSAGIAAARAAAGGDNNRLSARSWAVYKRVRTKAKRINTAAIATFAKCRALASAGASNSKLQSCLGASITAVVTEGKKVLKVLRGFDDEVGGGCRASLTNLEGYTKLYIASVNALHTTIAGGGVGGQTGIESQIENAGTALARARAAQPKFEGACRPK